MNNMLMLIRREIWENRSLWITPLVIAGLVIITAAFGGHADGHEFWFKSDGGQLTLHPLSGLTERQAVYAMTLAGISLMQLFTLGIVVFFYLLDSLLSERKDRSILFWKSLPISDGEVVASKALTALVVAPLYVLVVSAASQLLFAVVWSLRFGGTPLTEIVMPWDAGVWVEMQAAFLMLVPATIIWYLPIAGYLMLVSVWARKNAFLWALLPPAALLMVEGLFSQSQHVANFIGRRFAGMFDVMQFHQNGVPTLIASLGEFAQHVGRVFTNYETWLGVLAGVAFFVVVVRFRRYRDDS